MVRKKKKEKKNTLCTHISASNFSSLSYSGKQERCTNASSSSWCCPWALGSPKHVSHGDVQRTQLGGHMKNIDSHSQPWGEISDSAFQDRELQGDTLRRLTKIPCFFFHPHFSVPWVTVTQRSVALSPKLFWVLSPALLGSSPGLPQCSDLLSVITF